MIVFTDWPGRSPQEVEDQVTYPLTVNMQGLPGVRTVRSSSAFGFSMVNLIFEDSVDVYFARTRVLERLNLLRELLCLRVSLRSLGPDATGVGQVFWYTVEGPYDSGTPDSIQDWYGPVSAQFSPRSCRGCKRRKASFWSIPNRVDPLKLRAYNIPLRDVLAAVERSNNNVGAKVVEAGSSEYMVRGPGAYRETEGHRRDSDLGRKRDTGLCAQCCQRAVRSRVPARSAR